MGAKRRLKDLREQLRSFAKDIVRLENEIDQTQYLEEERRITITKSLEIKLFIASIKLQGVVERIFRIKNNDKTGRNESVRDSAEDDMEDTE